MCVVCKQQQLMGGEGHEFEREHKQFMGGLQSGK